MQVAVFHQGALVVDAVAGVADSRTGRGVTPETPFFSFSAGKVMTSLIAHLLVGTGAVGYDTPVVDLWPEFGAHGKATATLRHVLTHSVGVPAMPRGIGPADLTDWSRVCTAIADAEPRWRPGTETGYHSFTFGFLVGEVARRATGKPMRLGRIGARPDEAPTTFGWVGGGGSYVYADTATGTSFAMTKNRLTPHFDTAQRIADLTTAGIDPPA
ncbi:beta-lactamase family protein [Streptomyces sp. DR7-3]|nr:beta-lactamase family protein [Streptomyces sp. DR7-3]